MSQREGEEEGEERRREAPLLLEKRGSEESKLAV